ncbi:autotransporter outer membrane beta-barrel domain-containing protein [Pedobacter cryotolerans]|uniref:Peptidase S74 domain-containing protein n=1 Tax=Pedobacter cryotolerans TaxID=2571270 RepID=A0A4U1C2E5_9SPHI|nr:hypothetical protein [Pedobacter cryotolerans]TKB98150.1 hypothetical protein FA045_14285 [Pedobacter cryotolerans]
MKRVLLLISFITLFQLTKAQQGFGTNNPAPSSVIDMVSTNKGFLVPRVSLTSLIVSAPINSPADALTVFNTATTGVAPNNVTPGYYYWSSAETKWIRLLTSFSADVRRIGTSHISEDAGVGSNGSTMLGTHNIAIGAGAMNSVSVGPSPFGLLGNVAIGGGNQLAKVTGPGNIAIGYGNNPNGTGGGNIGIGGLNLSAVTTGEGNYAIGIESQQAVTTGSQNISLGAAVLKVATGNKNIGMGNDVLTVLASGNDNVGFGVAAGGALTTGNYNTFFGTEAGNRLTGPISDHYTSGDFGLFLGSQTKAKNALDNQLNIGNWIYGENGALALGNFTGGTALPTITASNRLDVVTGNVGVRDINAAYTLSGTDKVVIADNTGVLRAVATSALVSASSDINLYKDNGTVTAGANRTVNIPHSTNLNFSGLGGGSVYTYIESGTIGLHAYEANGVIEISTEGSNSDITLSTAVAGSDVLLQPQTTDKFVGIGTVSPTQKLDVGIGNVRVRDITATHTLAATDKVVIADNAGVLRSVDKSVLAVEPWFVQGGALQSNLNADPIYHTGSVAIGIASSASIPSAEVTAHNPKLYIEGNVSTTGSYYTASSVYADYVFEKYFAGKSEINPNYEFKSLNYVRDFIKTKHHLPGVTSIADLRKANNGYTFDMTKLTVQSLEKIEELYLHTIEQKDKIDAQQNEIEKLKKDAEDTKARLQRLEKLFNKAN